VNKQAWLVFALTAIVVIAVGLLILSVVSIWGRLGGGMMGPGYPGYYRRGMMGPMGFLSSALVCTVSLILLALAVAGVIWFVRLQGPRRKSQGSFCPQCGREVQADWKVCPYCGQQLKE
jgi:hypothetical protein